MLLFLFISIGRSYLYFLWIITIPAPHLRIIDYARESWKILIQLSRNQPAKAKFKTPSAPFHYSFLPFLLISSQHLWNNLGSIMEHLLWCRQEVTYPLILSMEPSRQKMHQLYFLKPINIYPYPECNSYQVNVGKNEKINATTSNIPFPFILV